MDRQLKQRVVGAAVLVVLGVIFIPLFLELGSDDDRVADVAQLPDAPPGSFEPTVETLSENEISALEREAVASQLPNPIIESVPEVIDETDVSAGDTAVGGNDAQENNGPVATADATAEKDQIEAARQQSSDSANAAGSAPRTDSASDDAWTVQLGSFGNVDNARRLIDRLRDKGYPGYLERQLDGDSTVFKVRVGPHVGRADALKARDRLTREFELKGMLVKYR